MGMPAVGLPSPVELAELFFLAADFGGEGFEGGAELVDLDGQPGEGQRVAEALPVFPDDGAQFGVPVEGGAADAGFSELKMIMDTRGVVAFFPRCAASRQ